MSAWMRMTLLFVVAGMLACGGKEKAAPTTVDSGRAVGPERVELSAEVTTEGSNVVIQLTPGKHIDYLDIVVDFRAKGCELHHSIRDVDEDPLKFLLAQASFASAKCAEGPVEVSAKVTFGTREEREAYAGEVTFVVRDPATGPPSEQEAPQK